MYVRHAHVHNENDSQRQRSHCTVLRVRASYILQVQYILNEASSVTVEQVKLLHDNPGFAGRSAK